MFDPSFFELIVICVVALVVLGPDKLPGAIKTLGLWIGRLRRSFNNIRREIEQEVGADEIRRQLRNEAIMEKFNSTKNQVTESIQSVKKEAEAVKDDLNLQKEFSGFGDGGAGKEDDGTGKEETGEADDIDPVEKLSTNDPAARTVESEQDAATTTPDAGPADPAGGQDGTSADNQKPEEKQTEEKQKNSDT